MKSEDIYLYRDSDNTWRAGDEIGYQGRIKSVDTADCPESNTQWKYADYDDAEDGWYWHSGDIKVHCSFSQCYQTFALIECDIYCCKAQAKVHARMGQGWSLKAL